jgi:hypothetical protein
VPAIILVSFRFSSSCAYVFFSGLFVLKWTAAPPSAPRAPVQVPVQGLVTQALVHRQP